MIAPRELQTASVDISAVEPSFSAIARVPRPLAIAHKVLPLEISFDDKSGDEVLKVATPHAERFAMIQHRMREDREGRRLAAAARSIVALPSKTLSQRDAELQAALIALRASSQCDRFEFRFADAALVDKKVLDVYGPESPKDPHEPLVNLANDLLRDAIYRRFTDIETEPRSNGGKVLGMLDNSWIQLHEFKTVDEYDHFVRIIKNKAAGPSLTPGAALAPQDGQFTVVLPHRAVDVRVNVMPSKKRETVWLRFHDLDIHLASPERLGMPAAIIRALDEAMQIAEFDAVQDESLFQPRGIILFVGPQGEGKSTTADAYMVHRLLSRFLRCAVVGNPIERVIDGIMPYEINERAGMAFEDVARALKRRKYYFTFIAEARDASSIGAAFSAGLGGGITGLTFHAADAVVCLERARDEFHIDDSKLEHVKLIISQRLVRRLCSDCKEPIEAPALLVKYRPEAKGRTIYRAVGCEMCLGTGYRRQLGIFEMLKPVRDLRDALRSGRGVDDLYNIAFQHGYRPMLEHALDRVLAGETSLEEAMKKAPKAGGDALPAAARGRASA